MTVRGVSTLRTILSSLGWLFLAEVAGRALTLLAIVHLTHRLGPESMGIVELGLNLFAFLTLVSLGGVEILATRQASHGVRGLGRLSTSQIVVAWVWMLPAGALVVALLVSSGHDATTMVVAGGLAASALLSPLALRFAFLGQEQMDAVALGSLLGQVIWVACVLSFVHGPEEVHRIPLLWLAGEAARVSLMLALFGRRFGRPEPSPARLVCAQLKASVPLSVGRVARGLIYFVDVLVLSLCAPLQVVGLYAVGLRLPLFLVGLTTLANRSLFPSFTRATRAGGPEASTELLSTVLPLVLSLSIAAACSLAVSGEAFLTMLFGDVYGQAALWMAILLCRAPAAAISGLYRMVLWSEAPGREAKNAVIAIATCLAALFILTPLFGPTGAALAMVLGEAVLALLYARATRDLIGPVRLSHGWRWRQGAVLLPLAGWAYWVQEQGVWTTILSAVVVGGLCGVAPLLPQLPDLYRALRR